ncbi:MAG TPA: VOC family protein [Myxococcaceae bacterium]|jgi:predicted 3-demethylubiquinone-9 3-methyltransferase (glyoxalase superfamily)|nr:VOC family protein [Myxococcaceae bacterium]
MPVTPKIRPMLWFDGQAEEAAKLYVSIFPNSKILEISRYGDTGPGPKGSVMTVAFRIGDFELVALNGGPQFKFTEAISLAIEVETQEEIDRYWKALTADGGQEGPCGWLKDRYGLSWQVVPAAAIRALSSTDQKKADRVMAAVMEMKKFDLGKIEAALRG